MIALLIEINLTRRGPNQTKHRVLEALRLHRVGITRRVILSPRRKGRKGGLQETLMTEAQPVARTAVLRQNAVLASFARVIIIVRYLPFDKEPGFFVLLHEISRVRD